MKDGKCQECGSICKPISEKFYGRSELGFEIPNIIYECIECGTKHIICPECDGNKFKFDFKSDSIFEDVYDCPSCFGMGVIKIDSFNKEDE